MFNITKLTRGISEENLELYPETYNQARIDNHIRACVVCRTKGGEYYTHLFGKRYTLIWDDYYYCFVGGLVSW